MSQEDMQQILAGLPVQVPGLPGPDLDGGPRFPPLTQDEINQIMANVTPPPRITDEEINQIFARATSTSMPTTDMSQAFPGMPQETQAFPGMPQESQAFGSFPPY